MVFGGVFASFCRRGQKGVAPEREISLWRKNKKRAVGDAGPYECEKGGSERNALGGAELSPPEERSELRQWRMQGGERVAAVKISSVRRQEAQKFWAPQQCTFYK